jgi:hypothetical protein
MSVFSVVVLAWHGLYNRMAKQVCSSQKNILCSDVHSDVTNSFGSKTATTVDANSYGTKVVASKELLIMT